VRLVDRIVLLQEHDQGAHDVVGEHVLEYFVVPIRGIEFRLHTIDCRRVADDAVSARALRTEQRLVG